MIKKIIKKNYKKVTLEDKNKSCITKKEIRKFKAEAKDMQEQFKAVSRYELGARND